MTRPRCSPICLIGSLLLAALLTGCQAIPAHEQILVSSPSMAPGDELVWSDTDRLGPQIESGRGFVGGGQSAGCTSCQ